MKLTVDRIENGIIIAELPDSAMAELPCAVCPEACEGDIIEIKVLTNETEERSKIIKKKMDELFQ